ncbi:MAG: 6-phosphogluconolactonase [Polyangiaceae bacterium]
MASKTVGTLIRVDSPDAIAGAASSRIARVLVDAIRERGHASLALSGGNTPAPTYRALAAHRDVDWSKVEVLWVDERAVPADHARSNTKLGRDTLVTGARVPEERVHPMDGAAADLEGAAADYERKVRRVVPPDASGGPSVFDVVVLGIGDDGHTASLFPGSPWVHERKKYVVAVPAEGAREARLSLTAPVIESARTVFVLAAGSAKAGPIGRVYAETGSLDETPARILRSAKGAVVWIVDAAAVPAAAP